MKFFIGYFGLLHDLLHGLCLNNALFLGTVSRADVLGRGISD